MERGRLIIDEPASGAWNMAVDEALLLSSAKSGESVLRFYRWDEPTLSLGYFQRHAHRAKHLASQSCRMVRRSTGGGAIVHDNELTYSICTPAANRMSGAHQHLYEHFHDSFIDVLSQYNVQASSCIENQNDGHETFLCFQRHCVGDVLIGSKKVIGSAQRRDKQTILQHGSILFQRSKAAPELDGIEDINRTQIDTTNFINQAVRQIEIRLELDFELSELSESESVDSRQILNQKYGRKEWNTKK